MTGSVLVPVLAVDDVEAARLQLVDRFGFSLTTAGNPAFGRQEMRLVRTGTRIDGLIALDLDHVAFAVPDADEADAKFQARGALRDPDFTPAGPRTIGAFWSAGARFIFFSGPEDTPFEFCARLGEAFDGSRRVTDHLAIRTPNTDDAIRDLERLGAVPLARHVLGAPDRPVTVQFLSCGTSVFEVFDEPPPLQVRRRGWIGVMPVP